MKRSTSLPISLILMIGLLALLIAGCTSGNNAPQTTDNTDSANTQAGNEPAANTPADPAANTAGDDAEKSELKGNIKISLNVTATDVWQAVADAYMKLHPGVKVTVDNKPQQGYKEWLTAQFAAGTPDADFVITNEVAELQAQKKFVNFYPYFEKENPYTGKKWKDSLDLDAMGINLGAVGADDALYTLNFESVQILWIYNKELFAKVGVTNPPTTFNEMIDAFKKLKDAGYVPLALAGDSNSIWAQSAGWLMRIYPDQYFRDEINTVRSQPDDYSYVPEIDDSWAFDKNDPYNDSNSNVTKNNLRMWNAIKNKEGGYKLEGNEAWKEVLTNLKTLFSYTQDGFFGTNNDQAYKLFLTGKAGTMLGAPASYWTLPKDFADETKTGAKGGVKPFEFGFFNMPSMEGPHVQAPARTIQLPIGFYSFVQKDAAQTELDMDFIMYLTSPEGYGVYVDAIQKSKNAALSGPPALRDITLPSEMQAAFSNFKPIGNMEGLIGPGNVLGRGLNDYQPSVQAFVSNIQKYFNGDLTVDQYLTTMQGIVDSQFEAALKSINLEVTDLEHPERKPPQRN